MLVQLRLAYLFSTSDHNSIISNILLNFEANHSDIRLVHKNFKASNFDEFNRYLSSINWSNIFDDAESVNDLWTKFCDVLNLGIEKFVPDHVECCNSKRVLYPLYIRKMLLKKKNYGVKGITLMVVMVISVIR